VGKDLTSPGDIVGTVRYMAPERFEGQGDSRADLYSLGATLYEMLTLNPAFPGERRAELIDRVRHEEPPRPRQLNPRIPRDLETVVLKAMAKNPAPRYQLAGELAEDLRRFLADRPVLARRSTTVERVWRWCRRKPAQAALIGALAVSVIVVTTISEIAAVALKFANERERESRTRAEQNRDLALRAVNTFFRRVTENRQLKARGLEKFRDDLLREAREFTEQLVRIQADDPRLRAEQGNAYLGLGQITELLGSRADAMNLYQTAEHIFARLTEQVPSDADYQDGLGRALHQQGNLHQYVGRSVDALACYQRALILREKLARGHPDHHDYEEKLHETVFQTARLHQLTKQFTRAAAVYQEILPLFEQRRQEHPEDARYTSSLAKVYHNLGDLYLEAPQTTPVADGENLVAALANLNKAQALGEAALHSQPEEVGLQDTLAQTWHHLGMAYAKAGSVDQAEAFYLKARDLRERLASGHPDVPEFQLKLATLLHGLGVLTMHQKSRRTAAGPIFEKALALFANVANGFPDDLVVRRQRAALPYDAACYYALASSDHEPAEPDIARALELLRQVKAANFFGLPEPTTLLETDDDLKPIRAHPGFVELLLELKKQAPSQSSTPP
jgi:tetratricopeptide (TPR) repeat protein